jgi:hypothetical protein
MIPNLKNLFQNTCHMMNEQEITYFLDFGSLLGAIREHSMIPYEFDIDIGIPVDRCTNIYELRKHLYDTYHYTLYTPTDYIPQKRSYILGYSGYITSPCARIYDENLKYYVDVYWYKEYKAAELLDGTAAYTRADGSIVYPDIAHQLPSDYAATLTEKSESVWCNDDGHTNDNPGGCRPSSWIYPIQTLELEIPDNERSRVTVRVPAQYTAVLQHMYGSTWNIQTPKGYKTFVCGWIHHVSPTTITIAYLAILAIIAYLYARGRYSSWYTRSSQYALAPTIDRDRDRDHKEHHAV